MHKGSDKCNPFSFRNVRKVSPVTHLKNCGVERPGLETFCLCLPLGNPGRPRAPQNDGRKILVFPGFPTRSRGIGRVSTKVASHGRRSAEFGSPKTGNGTRTTNRVALLRLISGRRTSGGRRTSEAALSLSNSDEWYCRRPANCRSSRGNRRLPRLLRSPSDFERGTARVERHRRALKRRDLNPSVWSYGIRQAVRKNKNPRCRSTGGS